MNIYLSLLLSHSEFGIVFDQSDYFSCMSFCHFQATQEFGLIIDRPNVREQFDEDFMKWAVAVIKYSKETQVKNSAIQMVVSQHSEDSSAGKFG